MDLETALRLLSLPAYLGDHPRRGGAMRVGYGRFGGYVRLDGDGAKDEPVFASLPRNLTERDRRRGLRPARPQAGAASAAAARGRRRGSKAAPEVTHGLKGLNALLVIVSRLLLMLTSSLLWSTSENILRRMPQGDPTCKLCRVAHTQRGKDTRRDTVFPKRKAREVVKSRSYFFTHTMKVVRQVGNPLATPRRLRLPTGAARPLAELSA